jgi:hypothetical protein
MKCAAMKYALMIVAGLAGESLAVAQEADVLYQSAGASGSVAGVSAARIGGSPVVGAPYSATITNESLQTLADGNRIVQSNSGTTARDAQGRTRQDAALPPIGNLSPENAPHLVFIMDPVAQTSYTLNLTDKTAQKMAMPPGGAQTGGQAATKMFFARTAGPGPDGPPPMPAISIGTKVAAEEHSEVSTEDLGTQTMEGLSVTGVRTTRTIPAGEIGNEKPISIVTEVWTSSDLKTIVYSKRSDPRMGEQTFKLTNIVRGEPDASLFTVPADFKVMDGPHTFILKAIP